MSPLKNLSTSSTDTSPDDLVYLSTLFRPWEESLDCLWGGFVRSQFVTKPRDFFDFLL